MNLVDRYDIVCPSCGETISLLERNLGQIVDSLLKSNRAAPQITFVCLRCKTEFRYDYSSRKPAATIDALLGTPVPWRCVVRTRCGDTRCGTEVERVLLGKTDTTFEQFQATVGPWDWKPYRCSKGHPPVDPESLAVSFYKS